MVWGRLLKHRAALSWKVPIVSALKQKDCVDHTCALFECQCIQLESTNLGHYFYGTAIYRSHPSHAKVQPLTVQSEYLHFRQLFSVQNNGPAPIIEPALQSSALPTKLILPRIYKFRLGARTTSQRYGGQSSPLRALNTALHKLRSMLQATGSQPMPSRNLTWSNNDKNNAGGCNLDSLKAANELFAL